jgi:hypothetical protein
MRGACMKSRLNHRCRTVLYASHAHAFNGGPVSPLAAPSTVFGWARHWKRSTEVVGVPVEDEKRAPIFCML